MRIKPIISMDSPYGEARLTKGLDMHGGSRITARWHRVKDNCEMTVVINMPDYQTTTPLGIWLELESLISHFVESVAYGSVPKTDDVAEGEFTELPAMLDG